MLNRRWTRLVHRAPLLSEIGMVRVNRQDDLQGGGVGKEPSSEIPDHLVEQGNPRSVSTPAFGSVIRRWAVAMISSVSRSERNAMHSVSVEVLAPTLLWGGGRRALSNSHPGE
jgi:hypothetical protein